LVLFPSGKQRISQLKRIHSAFCSALDDGGLTQSASPAAPAFSSWRCPG